MTTILIVHLRILGEYLRGLRSEDGQGLSEYALILALIGVIAIVALKFLGSKISDAPQHDRQQPGGARADHSGW